MYNVIRVEKNRDYTVISNTHLMDTTLSLKAKGIMTILLALPNDTWELSVEGLSKLSRDKRDSVSTALKELEDNHYLVRKQRFDDRNRFSGYQYTLYERPQKESPFTEIPYTEKPFTENKQQLNTNISNTDISSDLSNNKYISNNHIRKSYFNDPDLDDLFNELLEQRKKQKAVNTERAIQMLVKKVYEYSNGNKQAALEIIGQSVENSWKGIFPLKGNKGKQTMSQIDAIMNA